MVKPGFILIGIAVGLLALLALLSWLGLSSFGPCGPDPLGLVLLLGFLLAAGVGLLLLLLGGLMLAADRIHDHFRPRSDV